MSRGGLSWAGIVRLGVVQMALGAIVVLTTSTFNRVIAVELALPATLPGVLVALHYFIQISRPRFGHGSDEGGRRTPWIIGGVALLGLGATAAAVSIAWMSVNFTAGSILAVVAYLAIGAGVGAGGTSLLVMLADLVEPRRKAPAATITFVMMIVGLAATAGIAGAMLEPFSLTTLIKVTAVISVAALLATILAVAGVESKGRSFSQRRDAPQTANAPGTLPRFVDALREVLGERQTRRFAIFVFISMLAYSAQDLVLEPYAGAVFKLTAGASTQLSGVQHLGVLIGMIVVAIVGSRFVSAIRGCMIFGCMGAAALLALLAVGGQMPEQWPLAANVFALGVATGMFAVAAIGSMMHLVSDGHEGRDGVRMGVWGAAQAIAFGTGGILGTLTVDLTRSLTGDVTLAYGLVFMAQAALFVAAAWLALAISATGRGMAPTTLLRTAQT